MKLILDTHTFIWCVREPQKLSAAARNACSDTRNVRYLSVASIWEMQIKSQRGKLLLPFDLRVLIARARKELKLRILSISPRHIYTLNTLSLIHKDPFDRMLAAQSIALKAAVVSADATLASYPISVLW